MSTKPDELEIDLDETDEGAEDEGGTEKEPTPEELKASVANLERALKKANREAARLRNEKKAADEPKGKEGDEKPAETKGEDKYKRSAVAAAARAELKDAGFTGTKEQAAKLSKLLDLDDLDVDEDGEVEGLEDAVADLKEQFPALFAGEKAADEKPKAPKVDASRKPVLGSVATSKDPIAEERYRRLFGDPGRKPARR